MAPTRIFFSLEKENRRFFSLDGAASVLKKSSIIFLRWRNLLFSFVIVVVAMKNNDKSLYSFYSIITPRLKSPRTIKILDFSTTTIAAEWRRIWSHEKIFGWWDGSAGGFMVVQSGWTFNGCWFMTYHQNFAHYIYIIVLSCMYWTLLYPLLWE